MATHSNILAWEIPSTEEPGVTRVRRDLVTEPPPEVGTIISWGLGQVHRRSVL